MIRCSNPTDYNRRKPKGYVPSLGKLGSSYWTITALATMTTVMKMVVGADSKPLPPGSRCAGLGCKKGLTLKVGRSEVLVHHLYSLLPEALRFMKTTSDYRRAKAKTCQAFVLKFSILMQLSEETKDPNAPNQVCFGAAVHVVGPAASLYCTVPLACC